MVEISLNLKQKSLKDDSSDEEYNSDEESDLSSFINDEEITDASDMSDVYRNSLIEKDFQINHCIIKFY